MKSISEVLTPWQNILLETNNLVNLRSKLWHNHESLANPASDKTQTQKSPFFPSNLRALIWKSLLLLPNIEPSSTISPTESLLFVLRCTRSQYSRHLRDVTTLASAPGGSSSADPLADDDPLWNILRVHEVLRQTIDLDVARCMPDVIFFRDPDVQATMSNVLFAWCVGRDEVGYRQGMHELVGVICWVLWGEELEGAEEFGETDSERREAMALMELLDVKHREADIWVLLSKIMETAISFYEPGRKQANGSGEVESPMVERAKGIFYDLLPAVDPELAAHLKSVDVLPQIFLMRWVRLMFGREFPLVDVLEMWDLLFSYPENGSMSDLINWVCVAMILRIRWDLLDADTNTALTLLLRYPPLSKTSTPKTLLIDARALFISTSTNTSYPIIERYTGQRPKEFSEASSSDFTSHLLLSPHSTSSRRATSPLSASFSSPATLEGLLSDAAKNVLATGEKWGVNQRVREAIVEVRKTAQRVAATSPSQGGRRGLSGGSAATIAASAYKKILAVEQRNTKLASMMDDALRDLWNVQEWIAEEFGKNDYKKQGLGGQVEKLGKAIAKMQFINAFLKDTSLPLPDEMEDMNKVESQDTTSSNEEHVEKEKSTITDTAMSTIDKSMKPENSAPQPTPLRKPINEHDHDLSKPLHNTDTMLNNEEPKKTQKNEIAPNLPIMSSKSASPTNKPRQRILDSPLSWMLSGNSPAEEAIDETKSFAQASRYTPSENRRGTLFGSESSMPERRSKLPRDRGLFGDAQEDGIGLNHVKSPTGRR